MSQNLSDRERSRLREAYEGTAAWKKWGPYLSERQWGTVREDYSDSADAWNHFTHDQARSRAYRWGEDGIAGISDDKQRLCFALALWNGKDPILKERLFGVTNTEGNHGEDVKEYYFYLDSSPTHSWMKFLYKYPQAAYPYDDLVTTNRSRSRFEMEYELIDTGVFDGDRYFDVFVEFAKSAPEDILIRITACNRGPVEAEIHILPTLWFRNTWSWGNNDRMPRSSLASLPAAGNHGIIAARHAELGDRWLYCEGAPALLFTENETNRERLFGEPSGGPFVKDAFHRYVIDGETHAVNPAREGTKAAAHRRIRVAPGGAGSVRLRLSDRPPDSLQEPFGGPFEEILASRLQEADAFYDAISPPSLSDDERSVMRQALAGML